MNRSMGGGVSQDCQRVGQRVVLILLRPAGAETVFLSDIPIDLGIALVRVEGLILLVSRVVGEVAVDRGGLELGC